MVSNQTRAVVVASVDIYIHLSNRRKVLIKKRRQNASKGRWFTSPLRKNISFDARTFAFTEQEFTSAFRMTKPCFIKLLSELKPDIQKNVEMRARAKRTTIPADMRIAITLRMLAGGK